MAINKKDIVRMHKITDIPIKKIEKAFQFYTGNEKQVDNYQEALEIYNETPVDSPEETEIIIGIAIFIT